MTEFLLPSVIEDLIKARNKLRDQYSSKGLSFTFDGNLVGDIGEVIASNLFGLALVDRGTEGIDALVADGRGVQIKTTGTGRGPAFRNVRVTADHLIFLSLDFDLMRGEIVYNGPETLVRSVLPAGWVGQKQVTMSKIRQLDLQVAQSNRLPLRIP